MSSRLPQLRPRVQEDGVVVPSEPRRRDAAATRQRLLLAARRRFGVLGYDRTTTRDIAADAGANVALISRYFGSKDGLYSAVLSESAALIAAPELEDGAETPEEARTRLLDVVVDGLRAESWASYGNEHPLLLMLRDTGSDPAIDELRRTSMLAGVRSVGDGLSRERAELTTALLTGLIVLRSVLGDELSIARDESVLRAELDRLLDLLQDD